ncbi:hypothetical protein RND81_14G066300 [Saponaria officinalis]|uniref:Uncharacterized protein n=1 Tax=Saponaria officinalis TaxID=3572 RepID=A0AAW1GP48_SAPOF
MRGDGGEEGDGGGRDVGVGEIEVGDDCKIVSNFYKFRQFHVSFSKFSPISQNPPISRVPPRREKKSHHHYYTVTTTTAAVVGEEAFDNYVVFHNHISLNSPETTAIDDAAVNFFSLAVDNSNNTSDELPRAKNVAVEREKNKEVEPGVERTLEQGWFRSDCRFKSPMLQLHKG